MVISQHQTSQSQSFLACNHHRALRREELGGLERNNLRGAAKASGVQIEETSRCQRQALGNSREVKSLFSSIQETDGQCDEIPDIVLKMVH